MYIGNDYSITMPQGKLAIANFTSYTDPALNTDPPIKPVTWMNLTSGELFTCIDNTIGANKWVGSLGTRVFATTIDTPTITSPVQSSLYNPVPTTCAATPFSTTGYTDVHISSDWEIADSVNFTTLVDTSYGDIGAKTVYRSTVLEANTEYWVRVRYNSLGGSSSSWSTPTSFTTHASLIVNWQGVNPVGSAEPTIPSGLASKTSDLCVAQSPGNPNNFVVGHCYSNATHISLFCGTVGAEITYPAANVTNVNLKGSITYHMDILFLTDTDAILISQSTDAEYIAATPITVDFTTGGITQLVTQPLASSTNNIYPNSNKYLGYANGVHYIAAHNTIHNDSYIRIYTYDGSTTFLTVYSSCVTTAAPGNDSRVCILEDFLFAVCEAGTKRIYVVEIDPSDDSVTSSYITLDQTADILAPLETCRVAPGVFALIHNNDSSSMSLSIVSHNGTEDIVIENTLEVGNHSYECYIASLGDYYIAFYSSDTGTARDSKCGVYQVDAGYTLASSNFHFLETTAYRKAGLVPIDAGKFAVIAHEDDSTAHNHRVITHPG